MTLSDVDEEGRSILITERGLRTRFRDSPGTPELLKPGRTL